jgi:long-chain acyl-CoA synthetase
LVQKPQVIKHFEDEIKHFNKKMNPVEQIKKIILIADEWSPHTGELSPSLKLKRKVICEKYRHMVDNIYKTKPGANPKG